MRFLEQTSNGGRCFPDIKDEDAAEKTKTSDPLPSLTHSTQKTQLFPALSAQKDNIYLPLCFMLLLLCVFILFISTVGCSAEASQNRV